MLSADELKTENGATVVPSTPISEERFLCSRGILIFLPYLVGVFCPSVQSGVLPKVISILADVDGCKSFKTMSAFLFSGRFTPPRRFNVRLTPNLCGVVNLRFNT